MATGLAFCSPALPSGSVTDARHCRQAISSPHPRAATFRGADTFWSLALLAAAAGRRTKRRFLGRQALPRGLGVALSPLIAPAAEQKLIELLDKDASEGEILRNAAALEQLGGRAMQPEAVRGTWDLRLASSSRFSLAAPLGRRIDGTSPGLEGILPGLFSIAGAAGPSLPASSSPIQRWFTSMFRATQVITSNRVDTLARINGVGTLRLSAAAATDVQRPQRLNFTFDTGYLELPGGWRLPYPVPFRLLGDEAKGWLETTYVSERVRISRGNKGTVFILTRAAGD